MLPERQHGVREEARELLELFAFADQIEKRARGAPIEFLIVRIEHLRIKMDANKNHRRPHIHIEYKNEFHAASYAIHNCDLLAGELRRGHELIAVFWIEKHREKLLKLRKEI